MRIISISGDTCSAFFVLMVLKTWGSIETAVNIPAATPIIKARLFDSDMQYLRRKIVPKKLHVAISLLFSVTFGRMFCVLLVISCFICALII